MSTTKTYSMTDQPQRGRPTTDPQAASSKLVMRITPHRKGAYVRACNGEPLPEWAQRHLDAAAGYNGEWIEVECTSPACRGKKNGGKGFTVMVKRGHEKNAECNECFCM